MTASSFDRAFKPGDRTREVCTDLVHGDLEGIRHLFSAQAGSRQGQGRPLLRRQNGVD